MKGIYIMQNNSQQAVMELNTNDQILDLPINQMLIHTVTDTSILDTSKIIDNNDISENNSLQVDDSLNIISLNDSDEEIFAADSEDTQNFEVIVDEKILKKAMNTSTNKALIDSKVIQYQQNANDDLFNEIYKIYLPKFKYVAFKMHNEDIEQELAIALMNAIKSFKSELNVKFNTYFWTCAKNHLGILYTRAWAKKRANNNFLVSLQQQILQDDNNNDTELIDMIEDPLAVVDFSNANFNAFLENTLYPHLQATDQFIISKYVQGYTHEEISKLLNTTTSHIHVCFRKLSTQPKIRKLLLSYFELDERRIVKKEKKNIQRRLTCDEISELIKSRLAYKAGDSLLTEAMIYARSGDINAKAATSTSEAEKEEERN